MKAVILPVALSGLVLGAPAFAHTTTIGNGFARSCYESAEARHATVADLDACDRALNEQLLSAEDRVATHVNRGILQVLAGQPELGDQDFDSAIAINSNEPEAWLNKGLLRVRQGEGASAVVMLGKAIELKTRKPGLAFYGRGLAHESQGNVRSAYADLVRARELEPGWSAPAKELARYQVRQR